MIAQNKFGSRRGSINWTLAIILASAVVLVLLVFNLLPPKQPAGKPAEGQSGQPLVVYCAASNKSVLEAIRHDYERDYKVPLEIQYGPSQTLLASLAVTGTGDLYLPADDSFLVTAQERKLIAAEYPLGKMQAVVAVAKGNPLKISKWEDLLKPEVRIAQASIEASAIGKMVHKSLSSRGLWDALHDRTTVYKTTVNEVANDVKTGAVDAGIVFDAVLHDYDSLTAVTLPELAPVQANVAIGVLNASSNAKQARHFARYAAASDKGLLHYQKFGFQPAAGDAWAEVPEVTLYSGSMLRPAIEQTIAEFEEREGARVTRVYNGCGILVAQMKAGQVPDAYFACDVEFMNQVKSIFPEPQDISQNELVILVKKGNPAGISSLKDLSKDGLRVGIGHEKQCAMGWLTQRTFDEGGVREQVMKNVVVQTPTGDMLVNQMRSGSLDAAVAYLSNAAGSVDQLDAIRIKGIPCSIARQPFGIAKDTPHKQLAERLLQAIRAKASQDRFAQEGFLWLAAEAPAHE
ncbi:Putative binding protein precursor [Anatilimnocola aggregata]|uniref:Binding protein n=1 Tax=Anatilimnocola aggregata TaxID=2528021 RepID=A0A517YD01_9BACT|nr:substrate-binding domain-containing protein [Anatilimnocola aggregata]QDU28116.1 Putative binding protein precursor [Anatilimnocola aggregata]